MDFLVIQFMSILSVHATGHAEISPFLQPSVKCLNTNDPTEHSFLKTKSQFSQVTRHTPVWPCLSLPGEPRPGHDAADVSHQ